MRYCQRERSGMLKEGAGSALCPPKHMRSTTLGSVHCTSSMALNLCWHVIGVSEERRAGKGAQCFPLFLWVELISVL